MTAARSAWIEGMRDRQVAEVARALGLEVTETRGLASPGHFPCPICDARTRHTKSGDRRGACSIASGGKGWHCWQCGESGDALELVMRTEGNGARDWCTNWLGLDALPGHGATQAHRAPRPPPKPKPPPPAAPAPSYPPAAELRGLWERCVRVDRDDEVARYLASRRLDVERIAGEDLARALPRDLRCPKWAMHNPDGSYESWASSNHRLLVPAVDAGGVIRSVIARRVDRREGDTRKSAAPSKYQRAGLVMACRIGERVLERNAWPTIDAAIPGSSTPAPWPSSVPRLVVTEGEIDFLAWACAASEANEAPHATLALYSGGWDPAIAARIPDGTLVVIATDNDAEGDGYARKVAASLEGRALTWGRHRYRGSRAA